MKDFGKTPKQMAIDNAKKLLGERQTEIRNRLWQNKYKMKEFITAQSALKRELAVIHDMIRLVEEQEKRIATGNEPKEKK